MGAFRTSHVIEVAVWFPELEHNPLREIVHMFRKVGKCLKRIVGDKFRYKRSVLGYVGGFVVAHISWIGNMGTLEHKIGTKSADERPRRGTRGQAQREEVPPTSRSKVKSSQSASFSQEEVTHGYIHGTSSCKKRIWSLQFPVPVLRFAAPRSQPITNPPSLVSSGLSNVHTHLQYVPT